MAKMKTAKRLFGLKGFRGIRHCSKCREGRLIELKARSVIFCGFCGYEYALKR
ncbi:MAG: hypothetical protein HYW25_03515 [Candidatus Aenigmarchaeota archaeon]|nr:hypothetical protein [Candidatus Aenigmarchaeota archaeon]